MNTPKTIVDNNSSSLEPTNFYKVTFADDVDVMAIRRKTDNTYYIGFTREEGIDLAKKILVHYRVPYCLKVTGE